MADLPDIRQLDEAQSARVAAVFEEHQKFIEGVARQHAVCQDEVPDIVQMVGLKVCQHLEGFRGEAHVRTWLFRITVNTARNHYQGHRRMELARDALAVRPDPDRVIDPDEHVETTRRLEALRDAVQRLRPIYREALEVDGNGSLGRTVQDSEHEDRQRAMQRIRTRRFRAQRELRRLIIG